jgi:hypothetical protein
MVVIEDETDKAVLLRDALMSKNPSKAELNLLKLEKIVYKAWIAKSLIQMKGVA